MPGFPAVQNPAPTALLIPRPIPIAAPMTIRQIKILTQTRVLLSNLRIGLNPRFCFSSRRSSFNPCWPGHTEQVVFVRVSFVAWRHDSRSDSKGLALFLLSVFWASRLSRVWEWVSQGESGEPSRSKVCTELSWGVCECVESPSSTVE